MFKYNELSDLLTGELVTPIRTDENDNIICLNSENEEVIYTFDDFDYDKTVEERMIIIEDEPEPEIPKEKSGWINDDILLFNLAKKLGYKNFRQINGYVDII